MSIFIILPTFLHVYTEHECDLKFFHGNKVTITHLCSLTSAFQMSDPQCIYVSSFISQLLKGFLLGTSDMFCVFYFLLKKELSHL